ncbi:hypothetical protein ABTL01_19700, partial [Acinetobacter baumannii]
LTAMLDFPRWKVLSIVSFLAALMLLAVPSVLPDSIVSSSSVLAKMPRISWGLDLAGGSYLLLEADTNDLVNSRLETKRDEVATEMRRGNPAID